MSKILRKLVLQSQSSSSYEYNDMTLMPFSDGIINKSFDMLEDTAMLGTGFMNTPLQGSRKIGGSYSCELDLTSIKPILNHAIGYDYEFGLGNTSKLSVAELNLLNCIQYANMYLKSFKLSGSKESLWKVDLDFFGVTNAVRTTVGSFPEPAHVPSIPLTFHATEVKIEEIGQTLGAIDVESVNFDITTGFDESFANQQGTLAPVWGMVQPAVKGSFKIPRYLNNDFIDYQENDSSLQLTCKISLNTLNYMTIEVPNFKIKNSLASDELGSQDIEMLIGRNGLGTTYINEDFKYLSPIKFAITEG